MSPLRRPVAERFWSFVKRGDPTICWTWQGHCNEWGYGVLRVAGRDKRAHRISHELFIGSIPEGHVVRHTCDNPPCVNPGHLRSGTQADNVADAMARGRMAMQFLTHCRRGHQFTPENTYTKPSNGRRSCRTCRHALYRRRKAAA